MQNDKEENDETYLMLEANNHQRTLRGVAGKRFYDIPGVVYPKEEITLRPGYSEETGSPFTSPPSWGITTKEAAVILGNGLTATRALLSKSKVRFQWVSRRSGTPLIYWNKKSVERLAKQRLPTLCSRADAQRYLSIGEAASIAEVGHSTIQRAVRAGQLPVLVVRVIVDGRGARKRCFFRRSELQKWVNQRRAQKLRAQQLRGEYTEHPDDSLVAAEEES